MNQQNDIPCLDRIKTEYPGYTGTLKTISDIVLQDPAKIIHSTIIDMAELCNVSEASIVRFCKILGYSGFNEFKIYLASELTVEEPIDMKFITEQDSSKEVLEKLVKIETSVIKSILQAIDIEVFDKVVNAIKNALRVELYAFGNTRNIAMDWNYRLIKIGVPAFISQDMSFSMIQAGMLTHRDVAVGISFHGNTRHVVRAVEVARKSGAITIAITCRPRSDITKVADYTLAVAAPDNRLQDSGMPERAVMMTMLDALYMGTYLKTYPSSMQYLRNSDKFLAEEKF